MAASNEARLAALAVTDSMDTALESSCMLLFEMRPGLPEGPAAARDACRRDLADYLRFLVQALATGRPHLFAQQVIWGDQTLSAVGVDSACLTDGLACIRGWALATMDDASATVVAQYLDAGIEALALSPSREPESCIDPLAPNADLAVRYLSAALSGDRVGATRAVIDAADEGLSVRDIYLQVFQPTLQEVGRLWQLNRISVADEHYITAVTQTVMGQLYPRFLGAVGLGKTMICASVGGELHEVGVRMVADFFEMDGWETYYLGANVPDPALLQAIERYDPDLIGLSATIGYHVGRIAELVELVRGHPRAGRVKIIVGGSPFNHEPDLWKDVGADGWANDANEAIRVGRQLVYLPT